MSTLERIEARIKFEQDKVYNLTRSPMPGLELQVIISTVMHLNRLKDAELKKAKSEK